MTIRKDDFEQVKLQPLERTTLSMVRRMIQEGRDVPPNMTTMLVMTIERMQGELEKLTEGNGACGYDEQGRAMIHVVEASDE